MIQYNKPHKRKLLHHILSIAFQKIETNRIQSIFQPFVLYFQIVQELLIIVENLKIHNIKVKITCNSVIYLNARKLVYFLLYKGTHRDADAVINVDTKVITDYNLHMFLPLF